MFEIINEIFDFSSYLWVFAVMGILIAIGVFVKQSRTKYPKFLIYSLLIYLACEILLGFNYSYLTNFVFLFTGAIIIGFAIGMILLLLFKRKK